MTNSRNKGAQFEREIAGELHDRLGITFKRDLDQYREKDRGDLLAEQPFPFLIECKRYAGGSFADAWWNQAHKAALNTGQFPAVVYRFDRRPVRVRLELTAAMRCLTGGRWGTEETTGHLIDVDIDGFAYLAREGLS